MNGGKDNTTWLLIWGWNFAFWVSLYGIIKTPVFFWLGISSFLLPIAHAMFSLAVVLARQIVKLIRRHRRRKNDRRIVAQAKAAEVWDKRPIVLGGRALELKAWEDFKIKREPGEPDAHLRRRCMTAADNELANSPSPTVKKKRHDEIDVRLYAYGEFERRQQDKGESKAEHLGKVYPEWVQPRGTSGAYNIGEAVRYNGKLYKSTIDRNIWAPDTSPTVWEPIPDPETLERKRREIENALASHCDIRELGLDKNPEFMNKLPRIEAAWIKKDGELVKVWEKSDNERENTPREGESENE